MKTWRAMITGFARRSFTQLASARESPVPRTSTNARRRQARYFDLNNPEARRSAFPRADERRFPVLQRGLRLTKGLLPPFCQYAPRRGARLSRPNRQFILPVFAAVPLLIGCNKPAPTQSTAPPAPAPLREALVGTWVMDQEATVDAFAAAQFGPQRRVVPNPKKPGQPVTYRTITTNIPFDLQAYAIAKSVIASAF
jgi:hypothetical protein